MADITDLLNEWHEGDRGAFDALVPQVYGEMKAIAAHLLRGERPGQLLDTGALVHEAYSRLVDQTRVNFSGRGHFFGAAANAMRRILVDQARRRLATKRGACVAHEDLYVAVRSRSSRTSTCSRAQRSARRAQHDGRRTRPRGGASVLRGPDPR